CRCSVASRTAADGVIQRMAGSGAVNRQIKARVDSSRAGAWLVDVGGGTGLSDDLSLAYRHYVCLDIDPVKLAGFLRKHPAGLAVRGDAAQLPFRDKSVNLVMCKAVSHHLDDSVLPSLFSEAARILAPDGRFVFLDAAYAPDRWRS